MCRSNYVRPKSRDALIAFLETFVGVRVLEKDGRVGFLDEEGGMPFRDMEGDDRNLIDCSEELGSLLVDDEVMVVMKVESEKDRYLGGYAYAIHSSGRFINVSID